MNSIPEFSDLLAGAKRSAVHLETRDVYYSNPSFEAWKQGHRIDWRDRSQWWQDFHDQLAEAIARGVAIRRARVISEPVTDYIRWEHYVTEANVQAGELVRWLPRRMATPVLLPANDFWIFDGQLMRLHLFAGNGARVEHQLYDDASLVEQGASAFERIWELAIPHADYEIH